MKKILLLIIITFSVKGYSQWTYSSGKSDFDGSYRASSVYGSGGEFPYTKPLLVINKFDDRAVNIYISNAGYSGCDNRVIYFKFNGDDNVYKTKNVGNNSNNDSWFISSFENINEYEFIEKLMNNNSMSVRIKSDCGSTDYKFTLSGSTSALSTVLGKDWIKQQKDEKSKIELLKKKALEDEANNKLELKEKEKLFLKKQQYQITLPFENFDEQKKEVEILVDKSSLKFFKKEFYINMADIKVYNNIYEVNEEFIIPRKTLIWIDENYSHKEYYKIKYANKYYRERRLYIEKKYLKKLFTE